MRKVTHWVCSRCHAEMTLDPRRQNPLRLFRPANACERFPHKWEKLADTEPPPPTERAP